MEKMEIHMVEFLGDLYIKLKLHTYEPYFLKLKGYINYEKRRDFLFQSSSKFFIYDDYFKFKLGKCEDTPYCIFKENGEIILSFPLAYVEKTLTG